MTDSLVSPFHPGERAMQERAGVRERAERAGRHAIRDFMPDQHREFFAKLPFVTVGSLDSAGRPWASILVGAPGFLRTPDARTLAITARPSYGDPLGEHRHLGAPIGLLGIEPQTRRRNRLNGTVVEVGDDYMAVRVVESFGNCPKYIQARTPEFTADPATVAAPRVVQREGARLSERAARLARAADTFFIATALPTKGRATGRNDVSHRGGRPGFVRVTEEAGRTVLTAPDFIGNSYFNTMGNLAVEPRAGLLFIDFERGDLLSLTGEAEIVWQGAELAAFAGAQRLIRLRVAEGLLIPGAVPLRFSAPEPAREIAATGTWQAVEQATDARCVLCDA